MAIREFLAEQRQRIVFGLVVSSGTFLLLFGPNLGWRYMDARPLGVVVVDKTVPFENYREHENFPWLLQAWKYPTPDGRFLDPAVDYVGFDPKARVGHDVTAAHVADAQLVFVADTYGVYRGDYEKPGDVAALERSPRIYGGFTPAEAVVLENFVENGGTLVGEFNTFASPTGEVARARIEKVFGVRWTKWVARYWPDSQDPNEVPSWVGLVYERLYDRPFDLEGPGLVFVQEDRDMVVLQPEYHLRDDVLTMERTADAPESLPDDGAFRYWLDVVEVRDATTLYDYRVDVNDAGRELLEAHGLSVTFPAVTQRGRAFYLAGDFVDTPVELGRPDRWGLVTWRRYITIIAGTGNERLMWRWYAPLLGHITDTTFPTQ